jgi:hypothetical protein
MRHGRSAGFRSRLASVLGWKLQQSNVRLKMSTLTQEGKSVSPSIPQTSQTPDFLPSNPDFSSSAYITPASDVIVLISSQEC